MANDEKLSLVVGERMRSIRLEVPEEILHRLAVLAQETGRTLEEVIIDAVGQQVARDAKGGSADR